MKRVYYVLDKVKDYYILNCASYGFEDDEEIMSSTNDIVYKGDNELIVGQYVRFENEDISKNDDKYIVNGNEILLKNDIKDEDRKEYDQEFNLSIKAYQDNDVQGIERWNQYLKSYEEKFMNFEEIKRGCYEMSNFKN